MNKKFYFGLGFLFTLSISLFIFDTIYQGSLPKIVEEINNSSIGAILTAIVTVLLLSKQSSSEEIKERNVRVLRKNQIDLKYLLISYGIFGKIELLLLRS
ncbi:MAG: hypothetical protein Q4A81_01400 [Pasteurellaceae bacterium]|nr:hypothetical protein [Pasteurellaceae bacterium]